MVGEKSLRRFWDERGGMGGWMGGWKWVGRLGGCRCLLAVDVVDLLMCSALALFYSALLHRAWTSPAQPSGWLVGWLRVVSVRE